MGIGLHLGQLACRPHAASKPPSRRFASSFLQLHLAVTPCLRLRLPPSAPTSTLQLARISPYWAHWRAHSCVPCRHSWRHSAGRNVGALVRPTKLPSRRTSASSCFCAPFEGGCRGSINGSQRRLLQKRAANARQDSAGRAPGASPPRAEQWRKKPNPRGLSRDPGEKGDRKLQKNWKLSQRASPKRLLISETFGRRLVVPFFRVLTLPPSDPAPAPQQSPRTQNP